MALVGVGYPMLICGSKDEELKNHDLVLYSSSCPMTKANAALIMTLYIVRTQFYSS